MTNDEIPRTAVNQGPGGGTDYPFAAYGPLSGRVLDVYLSYADPGCEYRLPFRLTVSTPEYAVTDADANVVALGLTPEANTTVWGDRTVYEWVGDTWVLRVVVKTSEVEDGGDWLDPRTINKMLARVESLAVSTDLSDGRRKAGNVALTNGYNTVLTYGEPVLTDGGRYVRQIRLDAVPTTGLGRAPGCEEVEPLVRTINNVRPDAAGNFFLTPGGGRDDGECFRVQIPAVITSTQPRLASYPTDESHHTLKIDSDCAPCCTCDYMIRTYAGLRRMVDRWQAIADSAGEVRDTYHRNRLRWLAQRACRLERPLKVTALPMKSCFLSVSATFCNMFGVCLRPVELRVTTETGTFCSPGYINGSHTNGDEKYVPGDSATVPGGDPVLVATFPYVNPQEQAHTRFRLRVEGCTTGEAVKVTVTVHAPDTEGADELPFVDDGTAWGSDYPTRALVEVWVAMDANSPGFLCED